MQIDCYGFEASSQWFRRKELDKSAGIARPVRGRYGAVDDLPR